MKVKLTYFRLFGKYYCDGEYETTLPDGAALFQIWEEVRKLRDDKKLPGLVEGHSDYIVAVDVPDHTNNYPGLLLPQLMADLGRGLER